MNPLTKRQCIVCAREFIKPISQPIVCCSRICAAVARKNKHKGNKIISSHGYVYVKTHSNKADKHGYEREHRMVIEKHLGRILQDSEIVHHINGNKTDNRLENLQVMTASEHANLHNNKATAYMKINSSFMGKAGVVARRRAKLRYFELMRKLKLDN